MSTNYDVIREAFKDKPCTLKALDIFIKAKEKYLKTETIEDRIEMKMKYVDIYEDIKCAYYGRKYSYETFLDFKKILQKME